ncbi:MAG: Fe-S cluster assembly protein SufD [Mangrovibacterium sp.]
MTRTAIEQQAAVSEKYVRMFEANRQMLDEGSSPVLNRMRGPAIRRFEQTGVPCLKNEDYKYTNLVPVFERDYRPAFCYPDPETRLEEVFRCEVPLLNTHTILFINGWYYLGNKPLQGLPEGVVAGSIRQIAVDHPDLLQDTLNGLAGLSDDPLVALNTALAQDGFLLVVPDRLALEKPIQVINLLSGKDPVLATQRNLIVVGRNSQARVLFCDHSWDSCEALSNSVTEIFARGDSVTDFYVVQNQHDQAHCINSAFVRQEENSNLLTCVASLHGGLIRNNLNVALDGEHAEAHLFGMSFTDKRQHVDNYTSVAHKKACCMSNQLYKNVLNEDSAGAFSGKINVARDAQKTNAFQRNNNVLLTDTARMNTKPQLIIDADDVKCSHGATVGQIDEEALFYLRARGIGEAEARLMLMNAFAHEVIQEIRIEPLRNRIDELVDKRLRGELARCHSCDMK